MSGPQNFLNRLKKELENYNLPPYEIINPHPQKLQSLEDSKLFKLGRLDGAYFSLTTPRDLHNMIVQRRGEEMAERFAFLKVLPEFATSWMTRPLMYHLNRASREVQRKSDAIVFQSELSKKMQERFVGSYFSDKPYRIILNGVPLDIFRPIQSSVKLAGNPSIAITASFRPNKRLHEAVRLVNHLNKSCQNPILHVFGEMDLLVKKSLECLNLSRVIFHGKVTPEQLPLFYAGCDFGITLCPFDVCPNNVSEMMACGLPVVTNKQSGAVELINEEKLIVEEEIPIRYMEIQSVGSIPTIDLDSWTNTIRYLMDNRTHFSQKARARAEEALDIKKTAKAYAEIILDNAK